MPFAIVEPASARSSPRPRRIVSVVQHVLLGVVGGYFLSAGLTSMSALVLTAFMPRSEAVALMAMLGFVIYLVVLLWAFAERRLAKLWLVLGGGTLAVQGLLWWLSRAGGGV